MAGHFVNPFLKMFLESHPLCVYIMFLERLCLHYSWKLFFTLLYVSNSVLIVFPSELYIIRIGKHGGACIIKGTVMQIEYALINDCLHVSKVSWKFCTPTIYNFAVIYPWNLLFFKKNSLLFNNFYCLFCL